jgi:hypothetical protein
MVSLSTFGTPWLTSSISATMRARPFLQSGSRYAAIIRW